MKHQFENIPPSSYPLSKSSSLFWVQPAWKHVELCAANYGNNVLGDSTHKSTGDLSPKQFDVLFKTVDALIQDKGNNGIIYINDLEKEMVQYTIEHLNYYLNTHYSGHTIILKPLVGDCFKIDIPYANSIHLKNPECWFFDALRKVENQKRLAYFADHSKEGLILATYFKEEFYEQVEHLNIAYIILNTNFQPYIHADGKVINSYGKVIEFCIKSLDTLLTEKEPNFILKSCTHSLKAKI